MALVAHTIYSHYSPKSKASALRPETDDSNFLGTYDADEEVTLEESEQLAVESAWRTESTFPSTSNRLRAPVFVPALYSSGGSAMSEPIDSQEKSKGKEKDQDVAGWYGSLVSSRVATPKPSQDSRPSQVSESTSDVGFTAMMGSSIAQPVPHPLRTKRPNWFSSAPQSSGSLLPTKPTPSNSLADILSRSPPPLPSEPKFQPPVFLELDPGSSGWRMLEKWGWREGEGLGGSRVGLGYVRVSQDIGSSLPNRLKKDTRPQYIEAGREVIDLTDDACDLRTTVDLTGISDSDDSDSDDELERFITEESPSLPAGMIADTHRHSHERRTRLLTPLPTVLKADRFGIGLKARTQRASAASSLSSSSSRQAMTASRTVSSSYRVPIKKITPTLARHLESLDEARKRRERFGRGRRGFEKLDKREATARTELLAYLNAS